MLGTFHVIIKSITQVSSKYLFVYKILMETVISQNTFVLQHVARIPLNIIPWENLCFEKIKISFILLGKNSIKSVFQKILHTVSNFYVYIFYTLFENT